MSLEHPVRALNAEVARKIAAGEVIDRPNAIVRELLDNAVDAGAATITVEIAGGGIDRIRVVDDGSGMTKDDLQNCARPHATSKISQETDLLSLSTLGFRGEALASVAAVSRLSVTSGGWKMRASITEDHILEPVPETAGTIVQSEGLFENFPARRQFLKRPATEGMMCRNIFTEKAMARPDIAFKFISDGDIKLILPAGQSLTERFIGANGIAEDKRLFYELTGKSASAEGGTPDWRFTVVVGEPAVSRPNKKSIFIYTNGRRLQEYSLQQAVEYGGQGFFPNGTYPVAAVFIEMNPKLVDFNIHPAKKEARFFDISELHHALSTTLRSFFLSYTQNNFKDDLPADSPRDFFELPAQKTQGSPGIRPFSAAPADSGSSRHITYKIPGPQARMVSDFRTKYLGLAEQALSSAAENPKVRYIGRCLGTFLLAEKNDSLYIIDQHAVHERILFDKIMGMQGKSQPLLIPYRIKTESRVQDGQLERLKARLGEIGFKTERKADGEWEISSVPERWTGTERELYQLLFVRHVEPDEIIRSIAAMTACKAAVKDGYVLDDQTAASLAEQAFTLPDPHCPHGRPVYTVISREQLFNLVKRT